MHVPPRRTVRTAVAVGLALAALHWATPSQADVPHRPAPVALTRDPVTEPVPLETMLRGGLTPQQAAGLVVQRQLVSLGVPRESFVRGVPAASPTSACTLLTSFTEETFQRGFTTDAGDLDGDRRRDVIEAHWYDDDKRSTGYVTARDARTGRALWSTSTDLTTSDPRHDVYGFGAVAAHVGVKRANGVLLMRVRYRSKTVGTTSTTTLTYELTGLDGHGRSVWHSSFGGSFTIIQTPQAFTVVLKDFPWEFVLGHFRTRAEDLVVHRLNSTLSGQRSDVDRYALDTGVHSNPYGGRPGSLLSPATDLLLPAIELDNIGVVPDQNGDGREDLYVVQVLSPGGEVMSSSLGMDKVVVLRGDTGTPVWESPPIPRNRIVALDAGVLTQESRIHDIAVLSTDTEGFQPTGTGQSTDRGDGTVLLLKGGTGALVWALPGSSVFPMQRFKGQRAIGLVSASTTPPTPSGNGALSLDVDIRDGQGRPIATLSHLVPVPTTCHWFLYRVSPGVDLTPDRSPDLQVWTSTHADGTPQPTSGALALDGATGKVLDRSASPYLPASLNGAGTSRLTWVRHARDETYYVRRGDKVGSVLAKVVVPLGAEGWTSVTSLLGTGARCADLLTSSYTPTPASSKQPRFREVQRLLGANGKPWWTLVVDPKHPLGRLTTGKGAKNLC